MSLQKKILGRIRGMGRGSVFVPRDFLDLGTRNAVDQALHRLTASGDIRRLDRGIYDFPRRSHLLGELSPQIDQIANAAARSTQSRVQISGARAANVLGVSLQVPAQPTYLTDGRSRTVRVGPYTLRFRHAAPRNLLGAGTRAGTVFQALRYLGRDGVDDRVVAGLRATLDGSTMIALRKLRDATPGWMRPIIDQVAAPASAAA